MYDTKYKIKEENNQFMATIDDKVQARCMDQESVLHAIWCLELKVADDFYVVHDGIVSRVDRGVL